MADYFYLRIELGNEAMQTPDDIADALLKVATQVRDGRVEGGINDINGNSVGRYEEE